MQCGSVELWAADPHAQGLIRRSPSASSGDNVRHANLQAAVQLITNQLEALQTALKRRRQRGQQSSLAPNLALSRIAE
ncbi:hypothetical protein WJX75_005567 [Coccomyxa subellipsoidea]|uniref:BHLH domain-containing protein n=1 Tax=Coccomyxa subellipsoidea TaxID=248742 RepID=A0ABR2Z576_9CHLO